MKMAAALCGALMLTTGLAPGIAQARDLTVTSWGGPYQEAQRKVYFEPFAAKEGIKVLEDSWNGGFGIIESKVKAGNPNWDAVQVEVDELELGCADGLYEPLDWSKIGSKDDWTEGAASDCGVGVIIWSTLIAYDADKLPDGPKSWVDFWDVKKFPGKRGMRKGAKMTLEFALMADGVAPKDVYKALSAEGGVDRAFKKLDELKPNIIWWESGAQTVQLVASGEVAMTVAYDGRINNFNKAEKRNLKVVWPGSIYATDFWVILKGAENKEKAMDFIAFASQPENMVKLPSLIPYGLPNKVASAKIPPEIAATLPSAAANMTDAISIDAAYWLDNNEELNKRFNTWLAQ
ncbi:MAG TPA: ABC transporter substrate-binding protein [Ancylobacter sp.]